MLITVKNRVLSNLGLKAVPKISLELENYHGFCGQIHVRSHAFESRYGCYSKALIF